MDNSKNISKTALLIRVLLFSLGNAVILATLSAVVKQLPAQWSQQVLVITASLLTLGLNLLFAKWQRLTPTAIGIVPGAKTLVRFGTGFLFGALLAVLQVLLLLSYGHISIAAGSGFNGLNIFLGLILYLFIALREELAFRAYSLQALHYKFGTWPALLIITFIFILEHRVGGMSWTQAIFGAGTGAVLFGIAAIKTKGIALPAGIHTAWNFVQWGAGSKNNSGVFQSVIEKGYEVKVEQIGLIYYLLIMWAAIAFIWWLYRSHTDTHINRY
jgi:membrane protease YdiL (CAAX protease family)